MSCVYFIRAGERGPVKIGVAEDFAARLPALQTGCPDDIVVLLTIPGDRRVEQAFHIALTEHRKRGEWFNPVPEVFAAIEKARFGHLPPLPTQELKLETPEALAHSEAAAWMAEMLSTHGLSARGWAERAGLGKDTVSRALRPGYVCTVSTRTIARLKAALPA